MLPLSIGKTVATRSREPVGSADMSGGSPRSLDSEGIIGTPFSATVKEALRLVTRSVLDRLFPWTCVHCDEASPAAICRRCLDGARWIDGPACPRCGLPLASPPSHLCGRCLTDPPSFQRLRALICYRADHEDADPVGRAIRALKYGRRRALAASLSELLAERFPFDAREIDVLVPVPLHVTRLRDRGFNQALLLAREPARRFGIPIDAGMLERVRATPSQVGLGQRERRKNLRGAFTLRPGRSVGGARILLVDDVCTSGATADACASVLVAAGARSVEVVTLARTLPR